MSGVLGNRAAVRSNPARPLGLVIVATPDVQPLDVCGPSEVFSVARRENLGSCANKAIKCDDVINSLSGGASRLRTKNLAPNTSTWRQSSFRTTCGNRSGSRNILH